MLLFTYCSVQHGALVSLLLYPMALPRIGNLGFWRGGRRRQCFCVCLTDTPFAYFVFRLSSSFGKREDTLSLRISFVIHQSTQRRRSKKKTKATTKNTTSTATVKSKENLTSKNSFVQTICLSHFHLYWLILPSLQCAIQTIHQCNNQRPCMLAWQHVVLLWPPPAHWTELTTVTIAWYKNTQTNKPNTHKSRQNNTTSISHLLDPHDFLTIAMSMAFLADLQTPRLSMITEIAAAFLGRHIHMHDTAGQESSRVELTSQGKNSQKKPVILSLERQIFGRSRSKHSNLPTTLFPAPKQL